MSWFNTRILRRAVVTQTLFLEHRVQLSETRTYAIGPLRQRRNESILTSFDLCFLNDLPDLLESEDVNSTDLRQTT